MTALILIALALALLYVVARLAQRDRGRPAPRVAAVPPPPARLARRDEPHVLYQYWHATRPGRIYIGISNDPKVREGRWRADANSRNPRIRAKAAWWHRSTREMEVVAQYPNWYAARQAEDEAIAAAALRGEPIENYQGNPLRRKVRRAA